MVIGWIAFAQETARPQFEVASIKLNNSSRGGSSRDLSPGGITYTNRALFGYIQLAFDVQPYQVSHGPAVSLADRYDIVAKASERVPTGQVQLMLRSLLEDRFKLKVHRETREISAYILTVARGGPHFKTSADDGPPGAFVKEGSFHYRRTSMAAGARPGAASSVRRIHNERGPSGGPQNFHGAASHRAIQFPGTPGIRQDRIHGSVRSPSGIYV